jgi:hypothetical protein
LDYDVYLHEVVDLVVVIPTSPRSSKRSPDAKVIAVFVLMFSSRPDNPGWMGGRLFE